MSPRKNQIMRLQQQIKMMAPSAKPTPPPTSEFELTEGDLPRILDEILNLVHSNIAFNTAIREELQSLRLSHHPRDETLEKQSKELIELTSCNHKLE
jgi:hypothetical protein